MSDTGLLGSMARTARRADLIHLPRRLKLFADPFRFARMEIQLLDIPIAHRLRQSDLSVYVRHHTDHRAGVDRVFLERCYRPPAPASEILHSVRGPIYALDVGDGIGMFGVFVLKQWPDSRITAVRPDPLEVVLERRCAALNRDESNWQVVDCSVEPDILGTAELDSHLDSCHFLRLTATGPAHALLHHPGLERVPVVALDCPARAPVGFAAAATDRLRSLGYATAKGSASVIWAWKAVAPTRGSA